MIVENLLVKLGMDASGYTSEARKAARATDDIGDSARKSGRRGSGALSSMSDAVGSFGKAAAGAFAVKQVTDFVTGAVGAAADLNESVNATQVVFGNAADVLLAYGQTAAQSVGLAQTEFNALATNSGALLTNFGFTQAEAAQESINLTERAADMASVFNTDVSDALGAVQAGLRGETEPLRRFGVSLDDASIRAKAVEMGLAATTAEVDKNGKAQAALALIYDQTAKVQGDFANTSGSLANQQRILAAEWENARAEIGQGLIPLFTELAGTAMDLLPAVVEVGTSFADLLAQSQPLIEILGGALTTSLGAVADYMGLVSDGTTSLLALFGNDAATSTLRFSEALDGITEAQADGTDQAAAYANGLVHMASAGTLTADQLTELGQGVQFVGQQQAQAIRQARDWAIANEAPAEQIRVLEEALLDQVQALIASGELGEEWIDTLGLSELAAERAAEATAGMAEAGEDAAGASEAMAKAGADAADGLEDTADAAETLEQKLAAATAEQKSLSSALLAAANPAFAAVSAYQNYQQTLADIDEDGKRTAEEQLELAEALLETQAALDTFSGEGVEAAADSIATALGISTQAARELLAELGVLDGTEVTSVVTTEFRTTRSGAVLDSSDAAELARMEALARRQHGGDVSAGRPFLVGEDGPELFVPGVGGIVFTAAQTARMVGGASMQQPTMTGGAGGDRVLQVTFVNSQLADDPMEGIRAALAFDSLEARA